MALRVGLASSITGALGNCTANNGDETSPIDSDSKFCYLVVRFGGTCRLVCKLTTAQGFTVLLLVTGALTLPIIASLRG